jgi:hypothetical protein
MKLLKKLFKNQRYSESVNVKQENSVENNPVYLLSGQSFDLLSSEDQRNFFNQLMTIPVQIIQDNRVKEYRLDNQALENAPDKMKALIEEQYAHLKSLFPNGIPSFRDYYIVVENEYSEQAKQIFSTLGITLDYVGNYKEFIESQKKIVQEMIKTDCQYHECEEILEYNAKLRENGKWDGDIDKVFILKEDSTWELCIGYQVPYEDTTDVEAVEIVTCPYCGEDLSK